MENRLVEAKESMQNTDSFDAVVNVLLQRDYGNRYCEERLGDVGAAALRQAFPLLCESEEIILLSISVRVGC